jgi:hypothetical protein
MIIKKIILGLFTLALLDGEMLAKVKIMTPFDITEPFTIGLGKGGAVSDTDNILLETGDALLLETGDKILME